MQIVKLSLYEGKGQWNIVHCNKMPLKWFLIMNEQVEDYSSFQRNKLLTNRNFIYVLHLLMEGFVFITRIVINKIYDFIS
jgi:hypothetical protein